LIGKLRPRWGIMLPEGRLKIKRKKKKGKRNYRKKD
jgi:hypothetical protein